MNRGSKRLDRAREFLAIAESGDAKREAYKRAAEEIAAHKAETGDSDASLARMIGRKQPFVSKLLKWRDTGFAAATPFLMDPQATQRAAQSHAKRVLSDPTSRKELLDSLDPEVRTHVAMEAREPAPAPRAPLTAEYVREPAPDPSDYELDSLVMDVARRARLVRDRVSKYGVRTVDDVRATLTDLDAAISDLSEVRAAVREFINEEALA